MVPGTDSWLPFPWLGKLSTAADRSLVCTWIFDDVCEIPCSHSQLCTLLSNRCTAFPSSTTPPPCKTLPASFLCCQSPIKAPSTPRLFRSLPNLLPSPPAGHPPPGLFLSCRGAQCKEALLVWPSYSLSLLLIQACSCPSRACPSRAPLRCRMLEGALSLSSTHSA